MHPHTHSWFGTKLNTPNPSVFYMYWGSWFLRPNKQIQILTCNSLNTQPLKYDLSTLFLNFIIQCISYSPQPWWAANLRILLPTSSSKSLISTLKGPGSSCVENSICAATGLKACALRTWTTPHSRSPLWNQYHQKSRNWQSCDSSQDSKRESFPCCFQLLVAASIPRCARDASLYLCGHTAFPSSSVSNLLSPS